MGLETGEEKENKVGRAKAKEHWLRAAGPQKLTWSLL
jgi:hypothetical protein